MKNGTAARMAIQPAAQPRILIGQDFETLQGTITRMISFRAYEFYEARGGEAGHELDDWVQAEQELAHAENLEVIDTGHEIRIRAHLTPLNTTHISVGVSPQRVIILGETLPGEPTSEPSTGNRRAALLQLVDLVPKVDPG
ncbi:MAG: DUF2934 domain-containing protein, partial [Candidatus Dormibacteraceae bacterium]